MEKEVKLKTTAWPVGGSSSITYKKNFTSTGGLPGGDGESPTYVDPSNPSIERSGRGGEGGLTPDPNSCMQLAAGVASFWPGGSLFILILLEVGGGWGYGIGPYALPSGPHQTTQTYVFCYFTTNAGIVFWPKPITENALGPFPSGGIANIPFSEIFTSDTNHHRL